MRKLWNLVQFQSNIPQAGTYLELVFLKVKFAKIVALIITIEKTHTRYRIHDSFLY